MTILIKFKIQHRISGRRLQSTISGPIIVLQPICSARLCHAGRSTKNSSRTSPRTDLRAFHCDAVGRDILDDGCLKHLCDPGSDRRCSRSPCRADLRKFSRIKTVGLRCANPSSVVPCDPRCRLGFRSIGPHDDPCDATKASIQPPLKIGRFAEPDLRQMNPEVLQQ